MIAPNGNCKMIAIDDLVKIRINCLETISIITHATTVNIIIANIVFATLVNTLNWFM